jgi:hypothetical protein
MGTPAGKKAAAQRAEKKSGPPPADAPKLAQELISARLSSIYKRLFSKDYFVLTTVTICVHRLNIKLDVHAMNDVSTCGPRMVVECAEPATRVRKAPE